MYAMIATTLTHIQNNDDEALEISENICQQDRVEEADQKPRVTDYRLEPFRICAAFYLQYITLQQTSIHVLLTI